MRNIFVTGGIHGDEKSGTLIVPELQSLGFSALGPCNPWGFEHNTRMLENGLDLNRIFHRDEFSCVRSIKKLIVSAKLPVLVDLHEDPCAERPYMYEFSDIFSDLGKRAMALLSLEFDTEKEPRNWFNGRRHSDGVIKLSDGSIAWITETHGWMLAAWAWVALKIPSIIAEVPMRWSLAKKMRWQRRVAEVVDDLVK